MKNVAVLAGLVIAACGPKTAPPSPESAGAADAGLTPATSDAGESPSPLSCEPTMSWKPRSWANAPMVFVAPLGNAAAGTGTKEDPYGDLQRALDASPNDALVFLAPGQYSATPAPYTDPSCGNCSLDKPRTPAASRGFAVRSKSLAIIGAGQGQSVLVTRAGYGLLIEDACEVLVKGLTITGGIRDPDGDASDAAVFVRRSRVVLHKVTLRDNVGLINGKGFPGIAGVLCREKSDVLILESSIENNSWDGVAVYRDGSLRIFGSRIHDGNGVGVGVTWNGRALVVNNRISSYWKGIGAFVESRVEARNNVVRDNLGWGLWVAQRSELVAVNNTIAYNDNLGLYVGDPDASGRVENNLITFNGFGRLGGYGADVFGRGGIRGPGGATNRVQLGYNGLFGNKDTNWVGADSVTTVPTTDWGATNTEIDPKFMSEQDLTLGTGSKAVNAGNPQVQDQDGSRSDLGATGGPDARKSGP
jgi:hypothetical protein